jgi:CBS domain-containing protein
MTAVREVMSKDLITVEPSTTVAEAATVMAHHHVGSALVMDGGALAGIFTERDIVRALSQDFDAPGHPISHWMTRNPFTVEPDAQVDDALERMLEGGFRHLPVTEGEAVIGMVSLRDVSRAAVED